MMKLKNSGHSVQYRKQILDSAMKGFKKMLEEDKNGTKPLFRSRQWNEKERCEIKKKNKVNWFNKSKEKTDKKSKIVYKSVLFVPPTPNGELAKQLKEREEELNKNSSERIKIIEKSGIKIEEMLVQKDPFPIKKCVGETLAKCMICKSAGENDLKISCRQNNVGYGLICHTCSERKIEKVYEGESGRSARLRGSEHLRGFQKNDPKNVIFKHKQSDHPYEATDIKMVITGKFRDALTRQCNEAVRIQRRPNKSLLNSKSEMNHPPLSRITVEEKKTG